MGIKKLVVATNEWFTHEKYRKFEIDRFIEYGFDVEIWNCNKLVFSIIPDKPLDLYVGDTKVVNFENYSSLRKALLGLDANALILNFYPDHSITDEICKCKVKYFNIYLGGMLSEESIENINRYYLYGLSKSKTNNNIRNLSVSSIRKKMRLFYKKKLMKAWPPLYAFLTGPSDYYQACEWIDDDRIIMAHHYDYDRFIRDENKNIYTQEYILFIDEAMGIHNESFQLGYVYTEEEIDKYRNQMKNLFGNLEKHLKKKVVIAAHPKAEYKGDEFGDRDIIQFRTYELLKKASLVVMHASTAMSMVILFNKPFLSVTTNMIENKGEYILHMKMMKKYFQCHIYNIDTCDDSAFDHIYCNKELYDKYIKDFVVWNRNDDRLISEILIDYISSIVV